MDQIFAEIYRTDSICCFDGVALKKLYTWHCLFQNNVRILLGILLFLFQKASKLDKRS